MGHGQPSNQPFQQEAFISVSIFLSENKKVPKQICMVIAYECARLAQGQLLVCVLEVNRDRVHVVTFFILLILR